MKHPTGQSAVGLHSSVSYDSEFFSSPSEALNICGGLLFTRLWSTHLSVGGWRHGATRRCRMPSTLNFLQKEEEAQRTRPLFWPLTSGSEPQGATWLNTGVWSCMLIKLLFHRRTQLFVHGLNVGGARVVHI